MNKQQNKQTAIYCRLSRDDEVGSESMSIQNQKTLFSQYAANNGFTDYTFYVDDGFSGTSFERPDFKRMIKDIEAGKIGTVIVKDLSRHGREYLQTGYYTEIFFPQNNVRFIAVNDGVDSVNGDNEFAPFKNIINEWYAKDCSRKIISALHTKAHNGGLIMGQAPYGYDKAKGNVHRLVPNENAWVVKLMFQLALEGKSAYLIAKELEQRKVMIPKAEQMTRKGLQDSPDFPKHKYVWGKRSIHKILTNPVYTGDLVCLRRLRKNFKTKQSVEVPKEEQVVIPNTHEAFVSHEDFETIQKRLSVKQRAYHVNPYLTEHNLLDYDVLSAKVEATRERYNGTRSKIKDIEKQLKSIEESIQNIDNYRKTKPIADKLQTVVFKERYRREHESELIVFSAAEKYIKKHYKDGKPPLIRELRAEQKALLAEKDKLYKDYYSAKCEMSELQTIKKNVDTILGKNKEQEQSRNKKRSGELE